jgi:hypothetical protein
MLAGESPVCMIVLIADHAVLRLGSNQVVKVSIWLLTMQSVQPKFTEDYAGS